MSRAGTYERLMLVDEPVDVRELNLFVHALRKQFERLDFDYVKEPSAPMAFMSCDACLEAKTDVAAEWVRRGIRLGFWYAQFRREAFANVVQRERQRKGKATRAAAIETRNADLASAYRKLRKSLSCLAARQTLRAKENLSLDSINTALRTQGIAIGRKPA